MKNNLYKLLIRLGIIAFHIYFIMTLGIILQDIAISEGSLSATIRFFILCLLCEYLTWNINLVREKTDEKS